jgi:hypothetical protein
MTSGLVISIPQRLALLRLLLVFSLLLSMAFTWKLWCVPHIFPGAPMLEVNHGRFPLPLVLVIVAALLLLSSLLFRWHRVLLATGLACVLMLVLMDSNRLQQWTYLYWTMLAILVFYNGRVDDPNRFTSYFILLQLIVCSFYFFTGLHQLQAGFIRNELPAALEPLRGMLSERQYTFCLKAGYALPFLVMFTSVALFIAPMRYLGITLALLFHLMLLLLRHPLRSGDVAGYLLHIVLMGAVLLLFSGKTKQRYFSPTVLLQRPLFYLVFAFFVVLPCFNNSGRWPDAMSANMHSGNRDRFEVLMPVQAYLNLPRYVKTFCRPREGRMLLDHEGWCRDELRAACMLDGRLGEALAQKLEFWNRGPVSGLELRVVPKFRLLVMP